MCQTISGSTSFSEHWNDSSPLEVNFKDYWKVTEIPFVDNKTLKRCKAFKTKINERDATVDDKVELLICNPPEKYFQGYCANELSKIRLQSELKMVDTSTNPYLDGSRKPDLSLVHGTVHTMNVIVLGEVKTMNNFGPGAKGELLTFLRRVRIHQQTRQRFYGFLTDGIHVLFMMLDGASGKVKFTPQLSLEPSGDGRRALISLLMATPKQLGFVPVECPPGYTVEKFLGRGATSNVYLVKHDETEAELVFKMVERASAYAEAGVLRILSKTEASNSIPRVDDVTATGMLISPVAQQFENPSIEHFCQLVDTVRIMHENKVFHRDIRPANWMKSRHGSLLIDFGYAIITGGTDERVEYSGTISFASIRVLDYLTKNGSQTQSDFRFEASDDLVSIVRVCYYYVSRGEKPSIEGTTLERIENSKRFWDDVIIQYPNPFKELNQTAVAKNYESLKEQLRRIVFVKK